jgi:phosphoglycerate kinase
MSFESMSFNKKTVQDIDVRNKRILVRCDFNVPLKDGQITDDSRIQASLPTIQYLLDNEASVILMSHLGRPKGKRQPEFSLAPVAARLGELLHKEVPLLDDCVGPEVEKYCASLQKGSCVLLENLRFHPEEEVNDPTFAASLAKLGDLYVNDAFGTMHRAHASTEGITHYLPAVAGLLVKKEIEYFDQALDEAQRPLVTILGGAKVHDKVQLIKHLLTRVDKLLIGGGCAFTFLKASGYEIGKSILEPDLLEFAKNILDTYCYKIVLPVDVVVANEIREGVFSYVANVGNISPEMIGVDIGPKTRDLFAAYIKNAGTVLWNGPMGLFEIPTFSEGTEAVAKALAHCKGISIVGGGDSAAALEQFGLTHIPSHVSTGGGATLELLEGKELPGLAALQDK